MGTAKTFEELTVWQKARKLTQFVYAVTADGAWSKDYGLREQIRRAAVSSMSNIAEGFERQGDTEFGHFLSMAKGSAGEVRSQFYVTLDAGYIDEQICQRGRALATEVSRMASALAAYLKEGRQQSTGEPAAPGP